MSLRQWTAVVSRRRFLSEVTAGGLGIAACLSACVPDTKKSDPAPVDRVDPVIDPPPPTIEPGPNASSVIDFGEDGPAIPRLIFFPDCKASAGSVPAYCAQTPVRIVKMEFGEANDPAVKLIFSNGRETMHQGNALSHRTTSRNLLTRESAVLKSVAAWTLDRIHQQTRRLIVSEYYNRVQQDFYALQQQEVLDAVPIWAIASLQKEIVNRKNIRGIQWDAKSLSFTIEAD